MAGGGSSDDASACARALAALDTLVDGELDPRRAIELDAHLDACRRCGFEADAFRALKRAVRRTGNGVDAATLERVRRFARRLPTRSATLRRG